MARLYMGFKDIDGEATSATFVGTDLTAINFDAEIALIASLRAAVNDISLCEEQVYSVEAVRSPQSVDNGTAHREAKALVKYHDSVTFEKSTLEIPGPDESKVNTELPGVYFVAGSATNHADWDQFETDFEAYVSGAGGNTPVLDEVIHVGRNL